MLEQHVQTRQRDNSMAGTHEFLNGVADDRIENRAGGGYIGPLRPVIDNTSRSYHITRRVMDIIGASLGLLLLSPFFAVIAILIFLDSPGGVFHRRRVLSRQVYTGQVPRMFDAFKFRTMIADADDYLQNDPDLLREYRKEYKLRDDPRITRIGGPLRRLSLDELPQLWNVLIGQMSLVGPRMITWPELEKYGPDAARLLSVKPGMTGMWQVNGRANASYPERVRLDMYYIRNRSLRLDLEILVRTVGCVLNRRGAV